MCQTAAYLLEDGREKLLMNDVIALIPEKGGVVRIVNLFGDELTVVGRIRQMDLLSHKILITA